MRALIAAASALVALPITADAESGDRILLESHVSARHADADYLLSPVLLEFERRGYPSLSTSGALIEAGHSATGEPLSDSAASEAKSKIVAGYEAYLSGRYEGAWDLVTAGADRLLSRSATMGARQELRKELYLALVVASLAANRLGEQARLDESMGEFIRSFPDKEMSSQRFGPEAVTLYRKIREKIADGGQGTLTIRASEDTVIFVNERYVGHGDQRLELFPGRYRVHSQRASTTGRVRRVTVVADETTRIDIDPAVDSVLRTSGPMVGFLFASEADREALEGRLSVEIGRALGRREVMLIGIRPYENTLALVATAYDVASGQLRLSAAVPIPEGGAPSPGHLRALVAYVSGDAPVADPPIVVLEQRRAVPEEPAPGAARASVGPDGEPADSGGGLHPAWRYAGWGLGAASVGAGLYLLHIDGKGTCDTPVAGECPENYNTAAPGLALTIGGAAVIVGATLLWALEADEDSDDPETISLVPTRGGAALVVGGTL